MQLLSNIHQSFTPQILRPTITVSFCSLPKPSQTKRENQHKNLAKNERNKNDRKRKFFSLICTNFVRAYSFLHFCSSRLSFHSTESFKGGFPTNIIMLVLPTVMLETVLGSHRAVRWNGIKIDGENSLAWKMGECEKCHCMWRGAALFQGNLSMCCAKAKQCECLSCVFVPKIVYTTTNRHRCRLRVFVDLHAILRHSFVSLL